MPADPAPTDSTPPVDGTTPKPEKESKLRPISKKEITIMLIGETGAGKTAFMSLLLNLFMGNGPYELEERNNPAKESTADKSQSQTNDATMYSVRSKDGLNIRILDTPGLADTRGIDEDEKHKEKINKAIQENVTTLDAVIIMANGTVQRLGAATDYTLNVITAMFPHKIINNIGFVFTHTDPLTFNFQKDSLQPELKDAKHWLIQNPLAYYQSYKKLKASGASEAILKRGRRDLEQFYDDTVDTLNEWLEWLDSRPIQPSKEINDLYRMSKDIEANIDRILTTVARMHDEREKWEEIQNNLGNTKNQKKALEDLKKLETAPFWDREKTSTHNTLCILPGCHSVCHEDCGVSFTLDSETLGRECLAFSGGRNSSNPLRSVCNVQGCGHQAESHRHFNDKWIFRNKELSKETREKLEKATKDEGNLEEAKKLAKERLDEIKTEMTNSQNEIRALIDQYNEMSLSKNFAGHIHSAIKMLEFRRKELESKPNTKAEVDLVTESIEKLKEKLKIIEDKNKSFGRSVWDAVKGVWRSL